MLPWKISNAAKENSTASSSGSEKPNPTQHLECQSVPWCDFVIGPIVKWKYSCKLVILECNNRMPVSVQSNEGYCALENFDEGRVVYSWSLGPSQRI